MIIIIVVKEIQLMNVKKQNMRWINFYNVISQDTQSAINLFTVVDRTADMN